MIESFFKNIGMVLNSLAHPEEVRRWDRNRKEVLRLCEASRFAEAFPLAKQCLNLAQKLWGEEHFNVAISLVNLGVLHQHQGEFQEAEILHLKALSINKRLSADENLYLAANLNHLGVLYCYQGKWKEAESNLRQSLGMRKRLLGKEDFHIIESLSNLATLYISLEKWEEAERLHTEALEMSKHLLGKEHPSVAHSLNNLGTLYSSQGRWEEAERFYDQALAMRKRLLGEEHGDIADSLNNLGDLYFLKGRWREAESNLREALEMRKRLFKNQDTKVPISLQNLAAICHSNGKWEDAESLFLEALDISRHLFGEEHTHVALCLNNLGELYHDQGRWQEAETFLQQAFTLRNLLLGDEHLEVARSLNNLGCLYHNQGKWQEAEKLFLKALGLFQMQLGDNHSDVAVALNSLATLYQSQERWSEAEKHLLKASDLFKHTLGNGHPNVATNLSCLAALYESQGKWEEAESHYIKALNLSEQLLGEEHPEMATHLNAVASFYAGNDRTERAFDLMQQALKIENSTLHRLLAASSERTRLDYIKTIRGSFDKFLSLVLNWDFYFREPSKSRCLIETSEPTFSTPETRLQAAFNLILRRKAVTATTLSAQNQALYSGRYPQLQSSLQKLRRLSDELVQLTFDQPPLEAPEQYKTSLADIERQYNELQRNLAREIPELRLQEQRVDFRSVACTLPDGHTLIEFIRLNVFDFRVARNLRRQHAHYVAFILPAGQPEALELVDLGSASAIDDLIEPFRDIASANPAKVSVANCSNPLTETEVSASRLDMTGSKAPLQYRKYEPETALKLRKLLWQPLCKHIKDCKHLLLSPDSKLNLIPFQLLPADETGSKFLMDICTIGYLSSGRDILRTQIETERPTAQPLILADPDYDLGFDQSLPQNHSLVRRFELTCTPTLSMRHLGERVAQRFGVKPYLGAEALTTHLTDNACPRILLIATHGHFDRSREIDPMMRSLIALAGANTWFRGGRLPPHTGKGVLLAREVAALDLWENELSVLSACLTGLGEIEEGEGVFGLRRAFAVAGAKTLILSLWSVPDRVTALLIDRFFDNLKRGLGRGAALQEAQTYIRTVSRSELQTFELGQDILKGLPVDTVNRTDSDFPLDHPFYWGAWICQGETTTQLSE